MYVVVKRVEGREPKPISVHTKREVAVRKAHSIAYRHALKNIEYHRLHADCDTFSITENGIVLVTYAVQHQYTVDELLGMLSNYTATECVEMLKQLKATVET